MQPGKAIIVGGSVGGLFIGVLLQRAGWDVEIFERSSSGLAGKGAGLVPQHEIAAILREIDREDLLRTAVVANERIFLDRDGEIQGLLRTPQAQMSWDLLFQTWCDHIPSRHYHLGRGVASATTAEDHAAIHLDNGSIDRGDILIGADGIGSVVRALVAPGPQPRYAGYAAFRGLSPEGGLPGRSAAVVSDRFTFFEEPGLQYLGYTVAGEDGSTLPGTRRYNWVWYRQLSSEQFVQALVSNEAERRTFSAPRGGLSERTKEELRAAARARLPSVLSDIVAQEKAPFLQGIFDYEAPVMYRGRVALLGDAAFVVRPHTAMGVAKAAADAMELRDALVQESSVEAALQRYSLNRMAAGVAIAHYGQRLGKSLESNTYRSPSSSQDRDSGTL